MEQGPGMCNARTATERQHVVVLLVDDVRVPVLLGIPAVPAPRVVGANIAGMSSKRQQKACRPK